MVRIFDMDDHARLPWRFHGRRRSRLYGL
jgi:hypothetical protein